MGVCQSLSGSGTARPGHACWRAYYQPS